MNDQLNLQGTQMDVSTATGAAAPVWWLVFKREVAELWLGGRALTLLILFSVLMSGSVFVLATNVEISLAPVKQMVLTTLQAAMTFGLFIGLIVAAESISGERERATLEPLLLTPASRSELVGGKFLAALSVWPAALALSIPYMAVLAAGDPVLGPALIWGALLGSLVAIVFAAFGMLVSLWSNTSRISLFVALLSYCLALLPSQLPGEVKASMLVRTIQVADPLEAANQFLQRVVQDSRPLSEAWTFLAGTAVMAAILLGLLFLYAAPRLRLEGGVPRLGLPRRQGAAGLLLIAGLVSLGIAAPVRAIAPPAPQPPPQIAIDVDHQVASAGDNLVCCTWR